MTKKEKNEIVSRNQAFLIYQDDNVGACGYFDDGDIPEAEGWVDVSGYHYIKQMITASPR